MRVLFERWDRSSVGSWVLILLVAVTGVLCGVLVRNATRAAGVTRPTAAPTQTHGVDPTYVTAELARVQSSAPGLRVLFIGNSFTYTNELPDMVQRLAATNRVAPRRILAVQYAPPNWTLNLAAHDPQLVRLLTGAHWSAVVLQEQSQRPALPYFLNRETLPTVAWLDVLIRRVGAIPLGFETWGYRDRDVTN